MSVELSGKSVPLGCDLGDEDSKWLCVRHLCQTETVPASTFPEKAKLQRVGSTEDYLRFGRDIALRRNVLS